jgi:hypothetical protein
VVPADSDKGCRHLSTTPVCHCHACKSSLLCSLFPHPPHLFLVDATMKDQGLWSMCNDPASYCSFIEQKEAIAQWKAPQRTIARHCNTYIHMVVPVCKHWAAVQVTISPFILKQFPGQTFFSSKVRYGPCCRQITNAATRNIVRDTVQKVIDSDYRPVS